MQWRQQPSLQFASCPIRCAEQHACRRGMFVSTNADRWSEPLTPQDGNYFVHVYLHCLTSRFQRYSLGFAYSRIPRVCVIIMMTIATVIAMSAMILLETSREFLLQRHAAQSITGYATFALRRGVEAQFEF